MDINSNPQIDANKDVKTITNNFRSKPVIAPSQKQLIHFDIINNYPLNANLSEINKCREEYFKLDCKSRSIYDNMMTGIEHTIDIMDPNISFKPNNNNHNPIQFIRIFDNFQNGLKKGEIVIFKIYYKRKVCGLIIDAHLIRMIGIEAPDASAIYILHGLTKHKIMKIQNISNNNDSIYPCTVSNARKPSKYPYVNIPRTSDGISRIISINHFHDISMELNRNYNIQISFTSILFRFLKKDIVKIRLSINDASIKIVNSLTLKRIHEAFIKFAKNYYHFKIHNFGGIQIELLELNQSIKGYCSNPGCGNVIDNKDWKHFACKKCMVVSYCRRKCRKRDWNYFHRYLCLSHYLRMYNKRDKFRYHRAY